MKGWKFLAVFLLFSFAAAGAASRKADKIQVVYQHEENQWQVFLFGVRCPGKIQVIQPSEITQPLEVKCEGER